MRKKRSTADTDTSLFNNTSLLGDTIRPESPKQKDITPNEISLQSLKEMFDMQLKENNRTIVSQLKSTIQIEINKAILELKADITLETSKLTKENCLRKLDIQLLATKIDQLNKENEKLKQEIEDLLHKSPATTSINSQIPPENHRKKIVLYGLDEYYKEHENDLHCRIIDIFRDIMHVELTGYIEDTHRIGKFTKSNRRPLVIELLSKRMTKYIVENSRCFQATRLTVSEYLDKNAREQRKNMRQEMLNAREKGKHAIIRDNKLFIDGKKIYINTAQTQHNETDTNVETADQQNNINNNYRGRAEDSHHKNYFNNSQNSSFRRQR